MYLSIKNMKMLKNSGQSLFEVVLAVDLVAVILVGLISAVTVGLANAQFSRNKAQATKYAQEAVEWLRSQRDGSWPTFYAKAGSLPLGLKYCLDADLSSLAAFPTSGSCASQGAGPINDQFKLFYREVSLLPTAVGHVGINITVTWAQGARTTDVVIPTYLTQWK
jgi:hypothetical protein